MTFVVWYPRCASGDRKKRRKPLFFHSTFPHRDTRWFYLDISSHASQYIHHVEWLRFSNSWHAVGLSERQSIHCLERRAGDSFLFPFFFFLRKQIESPGESQGRRGIMTRRCFLRKRLIDNRSRRGTAKLYTRANAQNFQEFRYGRVPRSSNMSLNVWTAVTRYDPLTRQRTSSRHYRVLSAGTWRIYSRCRI